MTQRKKDFTSQAMKFISETSSPESLPETQAPALQPITAQAGPDDSADEPPAGYHKDPRFVENKSRRLQLLVQPSLYKALKAGADKAGLSLNEYVHRLLKSAVQKEG